MNELLKKLDMLDTQTTDGVIQDVKLREEGLRNSDDLEVLDYLDRQANLDYGGYLTGYRQALEHVRIHLGKRQKI